MSAPKGNEFWKCRSSHGPNPKFAGPEELMEACSEYFQWVEANPLWEGKIVSDGGKPVLETIPKMRAMTLAGLCIFLGVSRTLWADWRKSRKDLNDVILLVDDVILTQKFEGASAGLLNANIISRDLGLSDKREVEQTNFNVTISGDDADL